MKKPTNSDLQYQISETREDLSRQIQEVRDPVNQGFGKLDTFIKLYNTVRDEQISQPGTITRIKQRIGMKDEKEPLRGLFSFARVPHLLSGCFICDQSYLLAVKRNSQHLTRILDDILDLAKIESGKLEIECIGASPCEIVDDVVELMVSPTFLEARHNSRVTIAG